MLNGLSLSRRRERLILMDRNNSRMDIVLVWLLWEADTRMELHVQVIYWRKCLRRKMRIMLEKAGRNLVQIWLWFRKYKKENVEQGCLRCSAVLRKFWQGHEEVLEWKSEGSSDSRQWVCLHSSATPIIGWRVEIVATGSNSMVDLEPNRWVYQSVIFPEVRKPRGTTSCPQ